MATAPAELRRRVGQQWADPVVITATGKTGYATTCGEASWASACRAGYPHPTGPDDPAPTPTPAGTARRLPVVARYVAQVEALP